MLARFQAHWRLKLLLTVLLNFIFWAGYAILGRREFFPAWKPPTTWFDASIPFQPAPWGWVYLSQFLFTGTLPWLIDNKEGLRRYVAGLALMSLASFVIFFFWPVASPRPEGVAAAGAMALILGYDGTLNAFPSLHAGFLVYMARLAWRMFGRVHPIALGALMIVWGGAILFATIATRQHYAIDLAAGAAIGALADWWAWRRSADVNAATTIARSNAVASHDGCK